MVLLTGIIILGIYSIQFVGFVFLILIISAVFGFISIRFPFMYIYNDHFVIEKKSIIKKYTSQETYNYDEIKEVEFIKGYTKWFQLIVTTIVWHGGYDRFSQPDRMKLKLKNDKVKIIYRFGNRNEFKAMVDIIQRIRTQITYTG